MEPTHQHRGLSGGTARDRAARVAGWLLVSTAAATAVMIVSRVAADADQPTLEGSLTAIASGGGEYALSGAARLVSGLTLLGAAWYLSRTWIIRRRLATPLVPGLFALSAAFTAVSGTLAVALASMASQAVTLGAQSSAFARAETISDLRLLTGKIGFALAGLALVVAARYQWRVGGVLRYVAPVSAILGIAMQFIWINSATVAHPIIGTAFLVWLVGVGVMLLTGRTERLFTRYVDNRAAT
ncbi:MAG: hypothetical protein F4X18_05810 [Acidimicrobiia bacterium]|nr:hypothetical protein [Acidimicrobiia bacterium]MYC85024.1 hypothetical protein [Acidimicrobiia bacterium]